MGEARFVGFDGRYVVKSAYFVIHVMSWVVVERSSLALL